MKPYITVLCSSTRVGGLDVLFETLQAQKFKDFELILNDALYYKRKNLVAEKASKYSFPVKHLHQLETATDMCKSVNNALVRADGNIIYFLPDYTWLDENCLQLHADFHKSKSPTNNKYVMVGHFCDCALPKLNRAFYRSYGPKEVFRHEDIEHKFEKEERQNFNNYMDDINTGKLDPLMWSLFEEPIIASNKPTSFEITVKKDILPPGSAQPRQLAHKNESYLLESLLDINGFNEALDGSHGWQDFCSTDRLLSINTKLYHNPEAIVHTFNPRDIMYARYRREAVFRNEGIWKKEVETNFKNPINSWSLREARKYLNE